MTVQIFPAIGVVGAGTMGRGILQLFAQAGFPVLAFDAAPGAAAAAVQAVTATFDLLHGKGRLTRAARDRAVAGLAAADDLAALSPCAVVVEAVVEDLAVKRDLFRALEGVVADDTILATNTSSLTVAEIAAACTRPERVAGLHFFNPVPLMKVVEVIAAVRTGAAAVERLRALVAATGHRAVVAADQPGFLVNHAGRGLYTEGLRIVEEGVATPAAVDRILREAAGFRMGPFELMDLTGLDVSGKVMTSIYDQFQQDPRYRPSSLVPPRVAAGLYGRKSGEGWYRYDGGTARVPEPAPLPPLPGPVAVWIDPAAADHGALAALVEAAGARIAERAAAADLQLIQPWGGEATAAALALGLDAARCVAVDPLPGLDRHRTLMLTAVTGAGARDAAQALLGADGTGVTVINDSPGFVSQRVLAAIVNIACAIAGRGIAAVADIEDAVKLGLGYPAGPLAWGDRIGAGRILDILRGMQAATGDPRYRPSPWLVRRAALGLSLLTPEAAR
ncbi:3-hydroxyacyl-CoA dehydrogenase [Zavarzinia compransoris]|uniref:3-hydroxyacyl-CoA dehydrogenase n=1 Tax=Zavarzinia compransoris TaxID=1264899 RepID=A0A317E6Z1_9PROT|nr:3-hydroxyacyl-CoA dehydrogenase [Zavarzinia compransoris]PWR21996.1 3-hydroxyacyl-CoA dehydrogenase [Zavarzinia compransoris]TDP47265.1 3-hydroxyacyl-CoA dehydrogenase [Zavarzinia compransoris]